MARRNEDNSMTKPVSAGSSDDRSARRWGTALAAGILALATFAAYYNSLHAAFVLDDHLWVEDNPNIRQLWPLTPLLAPTDPGNFGGRPVISATLALNYALGGTDPRGYHAFNLVIHILAVLTLFGVIRRTLLLPTVEPRFGKVATPLAFAAALLWAVHPLQTQAVTYMIQRTESLVGLFYLLTLYCVIRGATAARAGRSWYAAAAAACILGMATKEVMVTAPVVILLYDRTFLSGTFRRAIRERWGLYLIFAASWGIVAGLLIQTNLRGNTAGFGLKGFTWHSYLLTQSGVLLHYLRLTFWPTGQCLDYGWPAAHSAAEIILPGLVIVGLLALTVWALVKRPALGFLGAWFFIILAPTSSFVPIKDAAFEHRMYLSLAAISVLVVLAGWTLWLRMMPQRSGRGADDPNPRWAGPLALLAAVGLALGWAAARRNDVYRSDMVMMQDAIGGSPYSARAMTNLAYELVQSGKPAEAIPYYQRALEIDPNSIHTIFNYAQALDQLGKFDLAVEQYKKWIELDPKNSDAYYNLGLTLHHQGKTDEAIEQFRRALEINPKNAMAHDDLGIALYEQKHIEEAMAEWRKAIDADPKDARAYNDVGAALSRARKFDLAIVELRRALAISPNYSDARNTLAFALNERGKESEAIAEWQMLLKRDPQHVKAHINLGVALQRKGRRREAMEQFQEASQFAGPIDVELLCNTGNSLAFKSDSSLHNSAAAIELWQAAARLTGFQNPEILEKLAGVHANLGQFARAAKVASAALELAMAQKNDALASRLSAWIKFYQDRAMNRAASSPPPAP